MLLRGRNEAYVKRTINLTCLLLKPIFLECLLYPEIEQLGYQRYGNKYDKIPNLYGMYFQLRGEEMKTVNRQKDKYEKYQIVKNAR